MNKIRTLLITACLGLAGFSGIASAAAIQVFSGTCTLLGNETTESYPFSIGTDQDRPSWDISVVRQGVAYVYELSAYNATGEHGNFVGFAWYEKKDPSRPADPNPQFVAASSPAISGVPDLSYLYVRVGDTSDLTCRGTLN